MPDWSYIDEVYIYDGTFYGFLTIVFDAYVSNKLPVKISEDAIYQTNFLDITKYIETDSQKAVRIFNRDNK